MLHVCVGAQREGGSKGDITLLQQQRTSKDTILSKYHRHDKAQWCPEDVLMEECRDDNGGQRGYFVIELALEKLEGENNYSYNRALGLTELQ